MDAPETISVFDMLKVGVGPSSSHTLGPWRAVQRWLAEREEGGLPAPARVQVALYGSLALTGKGHHTDTAVALALDGHDPCSVEVERIGALVEALRERGTVRLQGAEVAFDPEADILFLQQEELSEHPNGMICTAIGADGERAEEVFFSIGGGFVLKRGETCAATERAELPYPIQSAEELEDHCLGAGLRVAEVVAANERAWRSEEAVVAELERVWGTMLRCAWRGCHAQGSLPGGLEVTRRAGGISRRLLGAEFGDAEAWLEAIRSRSWRFAEVLQWVSCFALAVNEENAGMGRVVTAPTNGAAGVIPAVLLYHVCFSEVEVGPEGVRNFLLVAGEIGAIFKKNATISAAMGGCQAEIGVSSAMAAAALTEALGGGVDQVLMAAEIAMEHHLGLTCDPIAGLVQVPCIERNAMGAVKAINAAELALSSHPEHACVSLDQVIQTMWETAQDMHRKYKETSLGGLSVVVPVNVPEC